MRCWRCDLLNVDGAATCARCGAALAPYSPLSVATGKTPNVGAGRKGSARRGRRASAAEDVYSASLAALPAAPSLPSASSGAPPDAARRRRSAMAITLALAVLLALAGFGAVRAAELLQHAMHVIEAPADLARTTCTAYTTQNYPLLTAQIDPRPVPPADSDAFNPAVVQTQLRALDKIQGPTQRCDVGKVATNGTSGQYSLTLQRARHTGAITLTLILRQQSDGSWRISRETNFAGTSA